MSITNPGELAGLAPSTVVHFYLRPSSPRAPMVGDVALCGHRNNGSRLAGADDERCQGCTFLLELTGWIGVWPTK
jgi:hypothetical protein